MTFFWFISGEWINNDMRPVINGRVQIGRTSFFWQAGTTTAAKGETVNDIFIRALDKVQNERPEWASTPGTNLKVVGWSCQPNEIKES